MVQSFGRSSISKRGLLKVELSKTFDLVAWDERTTILVNKQSKLQRAKIYWFARKHAKISNKVYTNIYMHTLNVNYIYNKWMF